MATSRKNVIIVWFIFKAVYFIVCMYVKKYLVKIVRV